MTTTVAIEGGPLAEPVESRWDELVGAARAGDRAALDGLLEAIERRVYTFAYRLAGDRAAAEDVAQDALLKICRRLDQYRGGNFLGWVYRIVVNQARDARRAAARWVGEPIEIAVLPGHDPARTEQLRRLEEAWRVLSQKERAALTLTDLEGLSSAEAARILGCLAVTARVRAAQARKKLRRELSRYYPELRETT